MKAAVLYEVRKPLRIEELEVPEVSDEDVLIKVAACGRRSSKPRRQVLCDSLPLDGGELE